MKSITDKKKRKKKEGKLHGVHVGLEFLFTYSKCAYYPKLNIEGLTQNEISIAGELM